jgi:hypothetical protein
MPTNAERFYRRIGSMRALQSLIGQPEDADFDCKEWPTRLDAARGTIAKSRRLHGPRHHPQIRRTRDRRHKDKDSSRCRDKSFRLCPDLRTCGGRAPAQIEGRLAILRPSRVGDTPDGAFSDRGALRKEASPKAWPSSSANANHALLWVRS